MRPQIKLKGFFLSLVSFLGIQPARLVVQAYAPIELMPLAQDPPVSIGFSAQGSYPGNSPCPNPDFNESQDECVLRVAAAPNGSDAAADDKVAWLCFWTMPPAFNQPNLYIEYAEDFDGQVNQLAVTLHWLCALQICLLLTKPENYCDGSRQSHFDRLFGREETF